MEKEWWSTLSPMIYGAHEFYDKTLYERKDYPADNSAEDEKRLIYNREKNNYRLKLGVWEGEKECDWNKLLSCVYLQAEDEKKKNQAFEEMKSILFIKGVINPESKIKFA